MNSYKIKKKVGSDHKILIENVPFNDGEEVEIIVSKKNGVGNIEELKERLEGSVSKYSSPFEAAINTNDWEII